MSHIQHNDLFLINMFSDRGWESRDGMTYGCKPVMLKYTVLKTTEIVLAYCRARKTEGFCPYMFLRRMFSIYADLFLRSYIHYNYNFETLGWSRCFTSKPSAQGNICFSQTDRVSHAFSEVYLHSWVKINKTAV